MIKEKVYETDYIMVHRIERSIATSQFDKHYLVRRPDSVCDIAFIHWFADDKRCRLRPHHHSDFTSSELVDIAQFMAGFESTEDD